MSDCVKRIVEQSKGKISTKEAKDILKQTESLAKMLEKNGLGESEALKLALKNRLDNLKVNLEKEKLNALKNLSIKSKYLSRIDNKIKKGISIEEAFLSEITGVERGFEGSRNSIDLKQDTLNALYLGKFVRNLEKSNLLPILNSKKFTKEIANDLWDISNGGTGTSGRKEATAIAKIIHNIQTDLKNRLNKAGADIGDIDGFIMSQTHDPIKLRELGEKKWIEKIKPLLNSEKSFDGADNIDEALSGAYQALVTGIRLEDPSLKEPKLFQFKGPANLAKKLSGKRQLIFKDADSFLKYNNDLGYGDFNDGILHGITSSTRDLALLERLGTNPKAMLDELKSSIEKEYRKNLSERKTPFKVNLIQQSIDEITGANKITTNPKLTKTISNIKAYQIFRLLGGVVISSISDLPGKALEYSHQGQNIITGLGRAISDTAYGFKSSKERNEFASQLGVGMEAMIGGINARFGDNENLSTAASKATRLYFKLNGLTWWTDIHKGAMARFMSHELGLKKDVSFNSLDVDTKRNLSLYDIGEKEWDSIRKSTRKMEDGRDYIFAEDITDITAAEKLTGYYIDRTNHGVITATGSTRARANMGAKRGTAAGEALTLMMQFKTFPIAYIEKVWGRALYGKGKADIPAMVEILILSTMFGYAAGAAKDLIRGKEPKDPLNIKTLLAAMAQGGGLGIYGDLLFQDTSSYGKSFGDILIGPSLGQLGEAKKLYDSVITGKDAKANTVKFVTNSLPLQNLPYVRAPLDNLILYRVQESLNPGYLRRMEKRAKDDYGQEYWLKPSK